MTNEPAMVQIKHPQVESAPDLPEDLKDLRKTAARLLQGLPSTVFDGIESITLADVYTDSPAGSRSRTVALGDLVRELPPALRRRRSVTLCLLSYGLFRAVLGLRTEEDSREPGAACRSARGASHLAAVSLEAAYPHHPVVRAVRLACDDDLQRLRLRPRETWLGAVGILTIIGTVAVLGLWNLAAPFLSGAFGLGSWTAAWGANRLALGLLEAALMPIFLFRRNFSPHNRALLVYIWGLAATNVADPVLGAAAGLGWLTLNLVGLALVALGGLAALQKTAERREAAP